MTSSADIILLGVSPVLKGLSINTAVKECFGQHNSFVACVLVINQLFLTFNLRLTTH